MKKKVAMIAVCVCVSAIFSLASAQQPAPPPAPEEADPFADSPSYPDTGLFGLPPGFGAPPSPEEIARLKAEKDAAEAEQRKAKRNVVQQKLLHQWKTTENDADRGKIHAELQKILKEHFEEHFGNQEKEIAQLEAKVKRLREHLELRRKKKEEIIELRLQQLLRDVEGLGWGSENETPENLIRPNYGPGMPGGGRPRSR